MANSKNKTPTMNLGEITTIRNILMGQQMQEYDGRFDDVKENLNNLETSLNEKINNLEKRTDARLKEIQNDLSHRFDKLEKLVLTNNGDLNNKIDKITGDDRQKMGELFAEISKRLLG